jgi:two-component system, NarL family, invasion response regulator UvrY
MTPRDLMSRGPDPPQITAAGTGDAGTGRSVRVMTVDDQAVFRSVAGALVDATPGFVRAGEVASGQQAIAMAAEDPPDLVLLDLRMPGMDGIETARGLKAAHPRCVVVLVSLDERPELPSLAASSGASAYVRKQDLSPRTLARVWSACGGHGPVQ